MKKPRSPQVTELEVTRPDLAPGDTLAVRIGHRLNVGDAEEARRYRERFVPRGVNVLVIDSGAELSVTKAKV